MSKIPDGSFFEIDKMEDGTYFSFSIITKDVKFTDLDYESTMLCDEERCHVRHLQISEKARKKGLGTAIIKAAEEKARELGAKYINVSIGWKNDDLKNGKKILDAFFTKNGFSLGHIGSEEMIERNFYTIFHYHKKIEEIEE